MLSFPSALAGGLRGVMLRQYETYQLPFSTLWGKGRG